MAGKKKWIQSAVNPKTKGSFKAWAKRRGLLTREGKVGTRAIAAGLKSRDPKIRQKANFARNVRRKK